MSSLGTTLSSLEYDEPSWLNTIENMEPATPTQAAEFLNDLDSEDFGLFVLAHGMGMRVGDVSQSLKLDPALVIWRMRRALHRAHEAHPEIAPASLELAITDLIRNPEASHEVPPPTRGAGTWSVAHLVENLDASVQERLQAQLRPPEADGGRSGLGIGVVILVLAGVAGFIVFGVIRDKNPLWRGEDLMRAGRFAQAREALAEHWDKEAAHEQIALCYLAVGDYDRALEAFAYPGVVERFGSFAPFDEPVEPLDWEQDSNALLPRGLVLNGRPTFVHRAGPPGRLHIRLGWHDQQVDRLLELEDSRNGPSIVRTDYPADWPSLPPGPVVWATVPWVRGPDGTRTVGEMSQADFQCLDRESQQEYRSDAKRFLDRSIPVKAHEFFLGNYLMRKGLYADAGQQFARLARMFPGSNYPRVMIERISAILGVEQAAFFR